jgi:mono/diheme cytochrome c family protein
LCDDDTAATFTLRLTAVMLVIETSWSVCGFFANTARQGEEITMAKLLIPAVYILLVSAAPVLAQETRSVDAGYRLAQEVCAECHGIEPDDLISPNLDAPAFYDVANKPGITVMALSVWFRTPHPTMPNFIFSADEASNLIAYIFTLKSE